MTKLKADLSLLMVTLGWGISYYLTDLSLEDMGPFTLNSNRFLIAFAVASILAFPKLKIFQNIHLNSALFWVWHWYLFTWGQPLALNTLHCQM